MGRPPNCAANNCCAQNAAVPCAFTDDFSTTQAGYTSTGNFTVSGGKLNCDAAGGSYTQSVSIAASGLRTISVQADCFINAGLAIGSVAMCYIDPSAHDFVLSTNSGAVTAGTAVSGDTVKLEIQETSTNVAQITLWQNGSVIQTVNGADITALNNPVACGPFSLTIGSSTPSWDNFSIACDDVAAGGFGSVAVVWKLLAPSNIQSTRFTPHPCVNCSLFNRDEFLYLTSSNSTTCIWQSADQIVCPDITNTSRTRPLWYMMTIQGHPTVLYAGNYNPTLQILARYTLASFNPLGPNVFTLQADNNTGCTDWPNTITVQPA